MEAVISIVAAACLGGIAGALISYTANIRIRFWTRFFELEKLVFDNPFLYDLWDTSGMNPFSSAEKWLQEMREQNPQNLAKTAVFLEMWGDAILESNRFMTKWFTLRDFEIAFTDRAKEVAKLLGIFHVTDYSWHFYSEKAIRTLGLK